MRLRKTLYLLGVICKGGAESVTMKQCNQEKQSAEKEEKGRVEALPRCLLAGRYFPSRTKIRIPSSTCVHFWVSPETSGSDSTRKRPKHMRPLRLGEDVCIALDARKAQWCIVWRQQWFLVKALPAPPSQLPVIIASVLGKTLLIVLITVNDLHFNNKNTTNRIP